MMRPAHSSRSWWQAYGGFLLAFDEAADYSPYDRLAIRVAQLEKRVAMLEPAARAAVGNSGDPPANR